MELKRDYYLEKLIRKQGNGLVKVITGVRRCGKSYLLFNLFKNHLLSQGIRKDHIITLKLDAPRNFRYHDPLALETYIHEQIRDDAVHYILLDEVQMVRVIKNPYLNTAVSYDAEDTLSVYDVLNGLLEDYQVDIYVTGSNSRMLSKDILTQFAGKSDRMHLMPLSFAEWYQAHRGDKRSALDAYLTYGGMPQLLHIETDAEKKEYLQNLFDEVYLKDIAGRYRIEYPGILKELSLILCSSTGSLTNPNKLSRTIKSEKNLNVGCETVGSYLEYMTDSFLFTEAKRYDVRGRRYFSSISKYYCVDTGLRNARLGYRQNDEPHTLENVVFNELLARGYSVDVGVVESVEQNGDSQRKRVVREIDFVVNAANAKEKCYIQVAASIDGPEKMDQELRPFLKLGADSHRKILITKTEMPPWIDEYGIKHIGIYDFLLEDDMLMT